METPGQRQGTLEQGEMIKLPSFLWGSESVSLILSPTSSQPFFGQLLHLFFYIL